MNIKFSVIPSMIFLYINVLISLVCLQFSGKIWFWILIFLLLLLLRWSAPIWDLWPQPHGLMSYLYCIPLLGEYSNAKGSLQMTRKQFFLNIQVWITLTFRAYFYDRIDDCLAFRNSKMDYPFQGQVPKMTRKQFSLDIQV